MQASRGGQDRAGRCRIELHRIDGERALRLAHGRVCVVLVLRGEVRLVSREGRFTLRRGRWHACDGESAAALLGTQRARGWLLELEASELPRLPALASIPLPNRGAMPRHAAGALRAAHAASHLADGPARDLALELALRTVLATAATVDACADRVPGRTRSRRRHVLSRLQRARLYLEANVDRVVRLDELARLTHFSVWHLSRCFRGLFGASPQAYGVEARLRHARRLVLAGELAICDVAAASGFENTSAFARAFSARFGCSASALRRAAHRDAA
jgi:AraC family transcriptional regulator